jgi:hypothetical protein
MFYEWCNLLIWFDISDEIIFVILFFFKTFEIKITD